MVMVSALNVSFYCLAHLLRPVPVESRDCDASRSGTGQVALKCLYLVA